MTRPGAGTQLAEADDVITLRVPRMFGAVGVFYRNFSEVSDGEVVACLEET